MLRSMRTEVLVARLVQLSRTLSFGTAADFRLRHSCCDTYALLAVGLEHLACRM